MLLDAALGFRYDLGGPSVFMSAAREQSPRVKQIWTTKAKPGQSVSSGLPQVVGSAADSWSGFSLFLMQRRRFWMFASQGREGARDPSFRAGAENSWLADCCNLLRKAARAAVKVVT